ncbi:hypothetical protein BH09ACT4_BH09ACT4_12970 [soil metagenome]
MPAESARPGVNPTKCDGVGMCALMAPEAIVLDKWGFPIILERRLDARLVRSVDSAISACPRNALFWNTAGPM